MCLALSASFQWNGTKQQNHVIKITQNETMRKREREKDRGDDGDLRNHLIIWKLKAYASKREHFILVDKWRWMKKVKALKLMLQMDRIDFTQIHSIWKEGFKECSNMNKTFLSLNSSVCLFV